jgi:prepilin-type N-terminal cleavage/methylation domain-containing protein
MSVLRRHARSHQRGLKAFSLIEVLVSLGVFSVIITTVGSVFFYLYRDWKKQKDYMNVLQDSYWAVEALSSEMRQATDIAAETNPTGWRVTTNYLPDKDCGWFWGTDPQFVWFWRGTRAGIANENETYGYNGFLYRGYGSRKSSVVECRHGAWEFRNVLCRFVTDYTYGYDVATNLVFMNLTLRPQPDAPEGPLNRPYRVNTVIRRRN